MPSEDHFGNDHTENQKRKGIIQHVSMRLRDMPFGIQTSLIWDHYSSGYLHSLDWWLLQTFQDILSVPFSRVKQGKKDL
jgi:hypothetical protein